MPDSSNKKAFAFFLIIVLLILAGWLLKQCNKPVPYVPVDIKKELKTKDSFRIITRFHDSTRITHLVKWRNMTRITDSMPCYTEIIPLVQTCDTLIKYDSLVIQDMKGTVSLDSVIIGKLVKRVESDSIDIDRLNRKLKRQKLLTKAAFFLGLGSGGFVGFKASK